MTNVGFPSRLEVYSDSSLEDPVFLRWEDENIHIEDEDGSSISGVKSFWSCSVITEGLTQNHIKPIEIQLKPVHITKKAYAIETLEIDEQIRPKSSFKWFLHHQNATTTSFYILQRTLTSGLFWLSIVDENSHYWLRFHPIYPHEANYITLQTNYDYLLQIDKAATIFDENNLLREMTETLESAPPPLSSFNTLLSETGISGFSIKDTMRKTLEQIVPHQIPEPFRMQLMMFLSLIINNKITKENASLMIQKYRSFRLLNSLISGHIRCIFDNIPAPEYFRIIADVAKGFARRPRYPIAQGETLTGWHEILREARKGFPDWRYKSIQYASSHQQGNQILTSLPITSQQAQESDELAKLRLALELYGYYLHATLNPEVFGLKAVLYRGSAYLWPTRYTVLQMHIEKYLTNIENVSLFYLPPEALTRLERVKEAWTQLDTVRWMQRSINPQLYNQRKRTWGLRPKRVINSMSKSVSYQALLKEFNSRQRDEFDHPSLKQCKILDIASSNLSLDLLEVKKVQRQLDVRPKELQSILSKYVNKSAIRIMYRPSLANLISLFVSIKGSEGQVNSVSRSLLKHMPTTQVMIVDDSKACYGIVRVPPKNANAFCNTLVENGNANDIDIEVGMIRSYRGYSNNLLQRLWTTENRWKDNIQEFISQTSAWRKKNTIG